MNPRVFWSGDSRIIPTQVPATIHTEIHTKNRMFWRPWWELLSKRDEEQNSIRTALGARCTGSTGHRQPPWCEEKNTSESKKRGPPARGKADGERSQAACPARRHNQRVPDSKDRITSALVGAPKNNNRNRGQWQRERKSQAGALGRKKIRRAWACSADGERTESNTNWTLIRPSADKQTKRVIQKTFPTTQTKTGSIRNKEGELIAYLNEKNRFFNKNPTQFVHHGDHCPPYLIWLELKLAHF
jgi:hypothetical protein